MMRYLQLQSSVFDDCFGRRPFVVRHHLSEHALFTLPRLVQLAGSLPAKSVEYNAGDLPLSVDPEKTPSNGLSAAETIRRIADCRSWMVLKNVEQDPEYRALMEDCLDQVEIVSRECAPGMRDRESFIFVSSPQSVTPYHMDPEENLLLQVRGEKTVQVFERSVLLAEEIERFHSGGHRNLPYSEAFSEKSEAFTLRPGLGLHIPVTSPHWVRNGDEVSISFSIGFQTAASLRSAHVHRFNARFRGWGMAPAPVGQSALRDATKQFAFRAGSRLARSGAWLKQRALQWRGVPAGQGKHPGPVTN